MVHATIEVARRVERAEIEFCALAGASRSSLGLSRPPGPGGARFERQGVDVLDAGGGRALFSRPGSPLNKVLGLGLHGPVTDGDLDRIEAFYRTRNAPTQIELCPLAYGDVAARLCARGYALEAFENELGMVVGPAEAGPHEDCAGASGRGASSIAPSSSSPLTSHQSSISSVTESRSLPITNHQSPSTSSVAESGSSSVVGAGFSRPATVTLTTPGQDDLWVRIVSEGFVAFEPLVGGGPDAKPPTTEQTIEMMSPFTHPNIRRYLAWIDGEPAGAGAAWAHEGVLGIFGTSTLPRFRRRGIQAAITIRAIEDGRAAADLAIATTAPGSTSQRTFERLGFSVLYTRAVFVRS
jgi:hypothetical protein